jgi:aryl-alcohol dehydrogenase-like predicted oxidoreductase
MEYAHLGRTGLKVSRLALGTMTHKHLLFRQPKSTVTPAMRHLISK